MLDVLGSILVFLPGLQEITTLFELIGKSCINVGCDIERAAGEGVYQTVGVRSKQITKYA